MFPSEKIRKLENLHIVFWLVKDTFWVLLFKIPGLIMIVPTVAVAAYLTLKSRHDAKEFSFNLAVLCWILANSIWMIGEFFFDDGTRNFALFFFGCGLFSIGYYYLRFYFFRSKQPVDKNL